MENQSRFNFTKTALLALPTPEQGKRLTWYDLEIPKLAVRKTHRGAMSFYVVRRVGASMAWLLLGGFPEMSVLQARNKAMAVLGDYAKGLNPATIRRADRGMPTVTAFFKEFGERHGSKKRAWSADQQRFNTYLKPTFGTKRLNEIARADIARCLTTATNKGKAVATVRNIKALCSIVFSKAVEWGYLEANPASSVKVSGKKVSRDRFLLADELPKFFKAVAEEPSIDIQHIVLLALLTGARRANVLSMEWAHLDLNEGLWRIPRTKNEEPQNVTLGAEAIAILETRKADLEDKKNRWVFPAKSKSGHAANPTKGVIRIMARAGIPYGRDVKGGVTLHDMRRTLGSWQAKTGASTVIIGKSLNHKSPQATAIYARLDTDPVRQSVDRAVGAMLEAGGIKPAAEVMPMKRKRVS